MGLKLYELDVQKMVNFAAKTVQNDEKLHKNREFSSLIMAPMALLEFRGVFYIVTRQMDPEDAKVRWRFEGKTAGIALPVHVTFIEDGQMKWDPMPAFNFGTTPEELIADYSTPAPISWLTPPTARKWLSFLYGLDNREET